METPQRGFEINIILPQVWISYADESEHWKPPGSLTIPSDHGGEKHFYCTSFSRPRKRTRQDHDTVGNELFSRQCVCVCVCAAAGRSGQGPAFSESGDFTKLRRLWKKRSDLGFLSHCRMCDDRQLHRLGGDELQSFNPPYLTCFGLPRTEQSRCPSAAGF